MLRILLMLAALTWLSPAQALPGPDPNRDWHSADSAHFRINYATPQRAQAERIADIAEHVYSRLSKEMQWEPDGKIEIIVLDEFDIANGYSTPLPFNESAIFLTPPNDGELLDNSIWLQMLLTHELTHVFHLDKVRAAPHVLRHIFGRFPLLFPNLWEPTWAIEGIATYNESTPELGQGRLRGPMFEAWMRIEHAHGFRSLAEMNADGRALPTSKQYLYGAYFYDFLARKYGPEAIYKYIDNYSGNIVPRVYTNPVAATGKHMDELWDEFIADLTEQMSHREAQLEATPRVDGDVILPAKFEIDSLAPVPDGVLAVVNDGRLQPRLVHIDAQGKLRKLAKVNSGTHIEARSDGMVLLAQPDICRNYNYYYDLYTWSETAGMQRRTSCGRYRRAAWLGGQIAALRTAGGVSTLSVLEQHGKQWRESRSLYQTPDQVEAVELAASPDDEHIALAIKQANAWQVLEFDSTGGAPRVLFNYNAPLHELRYSRTGDALEFVAVRDGTYDLWRYTFGSNELTRLSHTYTAVLLHSGIAQDGSVVLGVLAPGGTELRRMRTTAPLAQAKLASSQTAVLQGDTPPATYPLGQAGDYHALYSMYPRSWLPAVISDRGLTAFGLSTFGSDAMGWHNYIATLMWETSQHEAIGSINYDYLGEHFFNVSRNLWARQWTGSATNATTTVFDRATSAQWASMLPWLRIERQFYLGIGAAMQTTDRVQVPGLTTRAQNERLAATFLRYDTRNSNWYADGVNRGNLSTLLYESYRPFNSFYNGYVTRFDTRQFLPLGDTVLSARWTEARAHGITEQFQLGGAMQYDLTQVPMLNQRNLPLRGYIGSEGALRGQNVRTLGIEWRTPLADIDRHAMSPPIGIDRLSASVFIDAGSVWDNGNARSRYYRGAGIELLGEIKVFYRLPLPLRLGIARGIDNPGGMRAYLQLGQSF
ncbi:hypothetical protein [Sideroxydans lithotrophicus]|uniref:Surface antigen (D15) n=1 Tax=Sideroxydans lithotrophicus (strain ES-1) TaxID=580332 RepID=D5CSQ4_SIDLE|nr:hypothetical protein [Sideroxydans lithotrophicus]ADE11990.1 hypothetical protein Slit_1759 [Sideroxydans lithotrophicus ES-1]